MSKERTPHYFKLRDVKTGREFFAEWSDIAGEWYEKETGTAHSAGDVEILSKNKGGARPGAGRPRTKDHRKNMTLYVPEETIAQASALRSAGVKVNELVAYEIGVKYDELKAGRLQNEK